MPPSTYSPANCTRTHSEDFLGKRYMITGQKLTVIYVRDVMTQQDIESFDDAITYHSLRLVRKGEPIPGEDNHGNKTFKFYTERISGSYRCESLKRLNIFGVPFIISPGAKPINEKKRSRRTSQSDVGGDFLGSVNGKKRPIRTSQHDVESNTALNLRPQPLSARGVSGRMQPLLKDNKYQWDDTGLPDNIKCYYNVFKEIQKYEESEDSHLWTSLGILPPKTYSASICFRSGEPRNGVDLLKGDVLDNTSKIPVWTRGSSTQQSQGAGLFQAIHQLYFPDYEQPFFTLNIPTSPALAIPEELKLLGIDARDSDLHSSINITPRGAFVDFHIDNGQDALNGIIDMSSQQPSCIKLWILAPPTNHNLKKMYSVTGQGLKFFNLYKTLQSVRCLITTQDQVLYLPAGCIHAVWTEEGGLCTGITWTTPKSISLISQIFSYEVQYDQADDGTYYILSNAIIGACKGETQLALRAWCRSSEHFHKLQKIVKHVKDVFQKNIPDQDFLCSSCQKRFSEHFTKRSQRVK
ncbi:hypothetical protein K402DRAFT_188269 [Aulographum hederae CBS 113979]|uniref:JmjC domain-containing protein n=1 Tax=Aulographum hederae CBS 113979 TaxID=1176131 RepID=A0A6G1GP36_9PEZI|nr:hypothetical protein K402DRAFT_188269 [Aulographum hederae CBS 113979]